MRSKIGIFTDGGARGNPGKAAIGVYIKDSQGKVLAEIGKTIGIGTNNVAEYKAVIEALNWVIENREVLPKDAEIFFFMDSLLVYSQIIGAFKVKDANLKSLRAKVKEKELQIGLPIVYRHVPREQNKNADRMVNHALDNI
ncbi:MAG: ribonuclease HI family protein [Candidatus Levybacteria bacterium]|nr:ribonuclease HI family protein [Candidatus Levybacteria bacterium]